MNNPEEPPASRTSLLSPEAAVGTGISVGALGLMFLLLGTAQLLREAHSAASVLFIIGAVLVVGGGLAILLARSGKGR